MGTIHLKVQWRRRPYSKVLRGGKSSRNCSCRKIILSPVKKLYPRKKRKYKYLQDVWWHYFSGVFVNICVMFLCVYNFNEAHKRIFLHGGLFCTVHDTINPGGGECPTICCLIYLAKPPLNTLFKGLNLKKIPLGNRYYFAKQNYDKYALFVKDSICVNLGEIEIEIVFKMETLST